MTNTQNSRQNSVVKFQQTEYGECGGLHVLNKNSLNDKNMRNWIRNFTGK